MGHQKKVLVATEKFCEASSEPRNQLLQAGFEIVRNPVGRVLCPDDYPELLEGTHYIIAGIEPYSAEFFEKYPQVKVLSRVGIGLNSIDLEAAKRHGVSVFNTPDAPTQSVAELTLGLILSLARYLPEMHQSFHQGTWKPQLGLELRGKKLGLVGFGRIGKRVASLAKSFAMELSACDPIWDSAAAELLGVQRRTLDEILSSSDIVSLHLPLSDSTSYLIGEREIALMKPTSLLINTSRGKIINDSALIDSLQAGRIKGAALDVFEFEPDPSRYLNVPNLLASPHVGSNTDTGRSLMELGAVENLLRYIETKPSALNQPTLENPREIAT